MVVTAVCPSCGHKYDVAMRLAGRKVRCKQCVTVFRVPVPVHVPEPASEVAPLSTLFDDDKVVDDFDEDALFPPAVADQPSNPIAKAVIGSCVALAALGIAWRVGLGEPWLLAVLACSLIAVTMFFVRLHVAKQLGSESLRRMTLGTSAAGFVAVAALMVGILVLMGVIPISTRSTPVPLTIAEQQQADQEALRKKYPGQAVTVIVKGFPDDTETAARAEEVLSRRIQALSPESELASFAQRGEHTYTLAPVEDPDAILAQIDFGQTGRRGLLIDVVLSPAYVASLAESAAEDTTVEGGNELDLALKDLRSDDRAVQQSAATRLIAMPQDEARKRSVVAALVPLLESGNDATAAETVKALSAWKTPESITVLTDRLEDPRTQVRHLAMKGLVRSGDEKAMQAVLELLKQEPEAVETALLEVGAAAEPSLFTRLNDPDPIQRRKACQMLAQLGGKASIAAIQPALSDRDETVRIQAAEALKAIQARLADPRSRN